MEEADKDPEEATNGLSTKKADEDTNVKVNEELKEEARKSLPQEEEEVEEGEKQITLQRITNLQRDLTALVTNIQTAADARESMRRTELEEARKIRLEVLENDVKSSQEKFEEITSGWSMAKEKVIPQELQEALNSQQQLCALLVEDKKKLINDLQLELKVGDERYVKDLRKQAEELDLMMERMEDQIKTLTKAYREELAQFERVYQQESEVSLARDMNEWEREMKGLWDKELERLEERRKKVEEYEAKIHRLMLETIDKHCMVQIDQAARFQVLEREHQQIQGANVIAKLKKIKQRNECDQHSFKLTHMRNRITSLREEMKKIQTRHSNQAKQLKKTSQYLSKECNRNIQQYERIQKKMKHFVVADARGSQGMVGSSDGPGPEGESSEAETHKAGTAARGESNAQMEEEKLPTETLKKMMELLCDEAGFLMEGKILKLLAPLEKEEQTVVKLGSLLCSFGLEQGDVPRLARFLLKYKEEQREQTEGVCGEPGESSDRAEAVETMPTSNLTSDLIHPNHVLPALKSFLKELMRSRESSGRQLASFLQIEARDRSLDEAYWESMGNIISEDKIKLWEAAENKLKQYLMVLTDISELAPETESLRQQNTELRMLLQQSLNSRVSTEQEMP
ncbi:dynein regulatory complex protein 1 [Lates japonicus]|uniref:Dynein regulatory complex protein 1 n=1 Tax=Lates japonicus TaxID=270547 RepID=A0AAD3NHM8_LATJO|nr:dynein regulatory complex protein 1 [Lates japonicus]GLD71200.1 dynein regulatory complex protein 1 [Lates japonicus]